MGIYICTNCNIQIKPYKISISKFLRDGLCSKCRGRIKYVSSIDKYRKINNCPDCGKLILKTSTRCCRCSQLKERNHQWKETKGNPNIYNSLEWRTWRKHVLERDNFKCKQCDKGGQRLAAHHIFPKREFPDLVFKIDNGITLCFKCHSDIRGKELQLVNKYIELIRPN
jgi:hypothetical protein